MFGGEPIALPLVEDGYEVEITFAEAGAYVAYDLQTGTFTRAGAVESFTLSGITGTGSGAINGDYSFSGIHASGALLWENGTGGQIYGLQQWVIGSEGGSEEFSSTDFNFNPNNANYQSLDEMAGTPIFSAVVASLDLPQVSGIPGKDFEGKNLDIEHFSGWEVEVISGAVLLWNDYVGLGIPLFAVTEGGRATVSLPAEQDGIQGVHITSMFIEAIQAGTVLRLRVAGRAV